MFSWAAIPLIRPAGRSNKMAGKPWERFQAAAPAEAQTPDSSAAPIQEQPTAPKPWERFQKPAEGFAQVSPENQKPEEFSLWRDTLHTIGRGLDYGGGLARTGAAGIVNIPYAAITGKSITEPDDAMKALMGEATRSSEFMKRGGVPAGDVVKYPFIGDVSTRDLAGGAVDIALDPLVAAARAKDIGLKIFDNAAIGAGKKLYKSGLKNLDIQAAKYGKEPVSDLLMAERVTGNAQQIQQKMDELATGYLAERDAILKQATRAGGEVDMAEAMSPLFAKINSIRRSNDPNLLKAADIMEKDARQYLARGAKEPEQILRELPVGGEYAAEHSNLATKFTPRPAQTVLDETARVAGPTPIQGSAWKSSTYNKVGGRAYNELADTPVGKTLLKAKAHGLKEATETSVEKSLGAMKKDELITLNKKLSQILTTEERAAAEAAKEIRKNHITSVDAMLGAGTAAASHNPVVTAGVMAAKKAADLAKSSAFRTKAGLALQDLGESGGLTPLLSRAFINETRNYSPWLKAGDKNGR